MTYRLEITPDAQKELRSIPQQFQRQIVKKIERLGSNPFPQNCKKLVGVDGDVYRIYSGDYRILYTVNRGALIVLVVRVGDRKDVYRGL